MKRTMLVVIVILISLTSCSLFRPRVGPPWMQKLLLEGPEGPTKFKQGWKDGCDTGISATSNRLQRSFYKFQQNYELSQDQVYYSGWKTAFDYCQRYVFQYLRRNMI